MTNYFSKFAKAINGEGMDKLKAWTVQGGRLADLAGIDDTALNTMFDKARQCYMTGDMENAAFTCCLMLSLDCHNDSYWELLGLTMIKQQFYPLARIAFAEAQLRNPKNPVYMFYLAQTVEAEENMEKAVPIYQMALEWCHHTQGSEEISKHIHQKLKGRNHAKPNH